MKTDKDYQINEENDTGEEHAKLVLSRLVQNPDKSVNEIIKDVVPTEINEMLRYALKRYVNETLNKESQHNQSSDGEENDGCYNCYDVVLMLDEQCPECGNGG
jgi:hypothetical protein